MSEFYEGMLDFRADSSLNWDRSIQLRIARREKGGFYVGQPVKFERLEPGLVVTQPALMMSPKDATALMDELWRAGVRPSSGEGNTGQLGAVQYHLEDMRRLVFEAKK